MGEWRGRPVRPRQRHHGIAHLLLSLVVEQQSYCNLNWEMWESKQNIALPAHHPRRVACVVSCHLRDGSVAGTPPHPRVHQEWHPGIRLAPILPGTADPRRCPRGLDSKGLFDVDILLMWIHCMNIDTVSLVVRQLTCARRVPGVYEFRPVDFAPCAGPCITTTVTTQSIPPQGFPLLQPRLPSLQPSPPSP